MYNVMCVVGTIFCAALRDAPRPPTPALMNRVKQMSRNMSFMPQAVQKYLLRSNRCEMRLREKPVGEGRDKRSQDGCIHLLVTHIIKRARVPEDHAQVFQTILTKNMLVFTLDVFSKSPYPYGMEFKTILLGYPPGMKAEEGVTFVVPTPFLKCAVFRSSLASPNRR